MTTAHWPEEIKPGVRVRATNKQYGFVFEFDVDSIDGDGELFAEGTTSRLRVYPQSFDVEVIPSPLPRTPGLYKDSDGDYWIIDPERFGDRELRYLARDHSASTPDECPASDYAPFKAVGGDQ